MRKKRLLAGVILGFLTATSLLYSQVIAKENNPHQTKMNQTMNLKQTNQMADQIQVVAKISQLLATEEIRPPLGVKPDPTRDIGFASVFLSLENHQETNQTITIQNIEIRNVSDNQLQDFSFESKEIELKPLENSVIDIHLTNKTGYLGQDQVKAIVTYQIGDQVYTIESEFVEVDRH